MLLVKYSKKIVLSLIVLMFVFVPHFFRGGSTYLYAFIPLILGLAAAGVQGCSLLILALSFCFPYAGDFDEYGANVLSGLMRVPYQTMRLSIIALSLYYVFARGRKNVAADRMFWHVVLFSICVLLIDLLRGGGEFVSLTNLMLYTGVFFCLAVLDEFSADLFFDAIGLMFLMSSCYAVLESYWGYSPYAFFYSGFRVFDGAFRARGLLGHPLVLSGFICLYQCVLFSKYFFSKKIDVFGFLILISIGAATFSRTTVVSLMFGVLLFLFYSGVYKSFSKLFLVACGFGLLSFVILLKFDGVVSVFVDRFLNDGVDQRTGAYGVVANVFLDYPLGTGLNSLRHVVQSGDYMSVGYDKDFFVLDNMFLTALGAYGFFSLLFVYTFFLPLEFVKRAAKTMASPARMSAVIACAMLLLMGFSFDVSLYPCLTMLYFLSMSVFIGFRNPDGVDA